ncbi:MAG: hypothetical protein Q4C12_05955, partial [Clostridia bacterium]|nr:hypothetical protein [Clostridia bacterium]
MKTALKIIAAALAVIVVVGAAVVIWQWPIISAIIVARTTSSEDLQSQITQNDDKTAAALEQYIGEDLRPFTEEELRAIENGETTKMQIIAGIISEKETEASEPSAEEATPTPTPTPTPSSTPQPVVTST